MRIKPVISSVVGNIDATHWGQALMMPHAYGVVEVTAPEGDALGVGVRALGVLTNALAEPLVSLAGLADVADALRESTVVTHILLVPVGPVMYIVCRGKGAVYLKRGEQISCLVRDSGEISGEVNVGDTLLLASAGFVRAFSDEELASLFDHQTPADVAEKLTLLFHERTEGVGGAALIFQVIDFIDPEADLVKEIAAVAQPAVLPSRFSTIRRRVRERFFIHRTKFFTAKAMIAAALIVIFCVSVIVGVWRQRQRANNQSVVAVINQAQYAFDEGVALLELNPVKGRQRLTDAKTLLVPLTKTLSPRSKDGRQVTTLLAKVTDNLTQAMHIVASEPQLFYDAVLLKKDAVIASMSLDGDTLGLLDAATKTVYQLAIPSKNGQIVAGGDTFVQASHSALHGDLLYVLTGSGIASVSVRDKKTTDALIKKDSQWGTMASMVLFGGNLYLLDTQKSRIWKYVSTDAGFSELREYLNPDSLPDLSHATSMAIDGSVWVGTSDGTILRFSQGREMTLIIKGVEPGFGKRLIVYTNDALKHVYVLDSDNKRVVLLDRDGMYAGQYTWQGNIAITQLVVSEALKKILFLAGGKIYSLEMK